MLDIECLTSLIFCLFKFKISLVQRTLTTRSNRMSKIGDIFSGGDKIGEVWTGDGSGCGVWGCLIVAAFLIAIPILLIQGLLWLWWNERLAIFALVLFPIASLTLGVMLQSRPGVRKNIFIAVFAVSACALVAAIVMLFVAIVGMWHDDLSRDHKIGGILLLCYWACLWSTMPLFGRTN